MLCAAAQTQDWANFGRFEQANGQVRNPKVVLMGNSITELWIKTHPDFFAARGYVSRGISGQTTSQMLVRFRADVLDLHPQVVVICGGTNDIAQIPVTYRCRISWATSCRWSSWRVPTASPPCCVRCCPRVNSAGARSWNPRP